MLLLNIKGCGYGNEELKQYESSLAAFIKDGEVAEELLSSVREPTRDDLPSPDVLRKRWNGLAAQALPSDTLWTAVAVAFRRQATKRMILSDDLRELLNAQTLQQLKELIERQGGVKVPVRRDKYSQRMRTKFSPVDLANLMPAYAEDPGRLVIRDVFVPQNVRENPPPVEIPKDLAERLGKGGRREVRDGAKDDLDEQQLEKFRATYVSQSPKPMLDVIAAAGNRLLVLTGEPGSGKSTLMRYLLTGIIEPPVDRNSGEPLRWTSLFKDAFPLLIELRDFYALRRTDQCDTFLEYVAYMGKTDQWSLDDHAVHGLLDAGPSLVMFDGLDEIFDAADRQRVMQEIAGFAQRYPKARIIVTSRPLGYKEQVLRAAGFAHFGIQDLDDGQIETFLRGWFALTFPQQPQQADQRIERVLGSVRQSKSIRLLAGNPMLLTIMALLAREQELPRERAKFYEKAVEVLCHHWDANRNLELPEDRYLNADDKKTLLRRIAMRMQSGEAGLKGNIIAEDGLEQEIQAFLIDEKWQTDTAEAKKAARRVIQQLRERNYILCLRGPHLYGFVHRTFLEYLTAAEYVRRFDKQPQQMTIDELIKLFTNHGRDDEWREVLRLICGQIDEHFVGEIIESISTPVNHDRCVREPPEIILAVSCLGECRDLTKAESAGRALGAEVIRLFKIGGGASYFKQLATASEGVGMRWAILPAAQEASHVVSHDLGTRMYSARCWVQFLCNLGADRSLILVLADDTHPRIREGALMALASKFADETIHNLLLDRAVQDPSDWPRAAALRALAEKWPNKATREFLGERAVRDRDQYVRCNALEALAERWPDETTRKFLTERAVQDRKEYPRRTALTALAKKWPDDAARKFLTERAVQDQLDGPRSTALEALADKWPDEVTRKLIVERARVDGAAASVLGRRQSEFGWIVFTKDKNRYDHYVDPAKPASRRQIERAATKVNIPPDKIDETVRSLSGYMGWDITRGANPGPSSH